MHYFPHFTLCLYIFNCLSFPAAQEIRQLRLKQEGFVREIADLQETVEWKDKKMGVRPASQRVERSLSSDMNSALHDVEWRLSLFTSCVTLHLLSRRHPRGALRSGLRAAERIHWCDPKWARWAQRRGGEAERHSEGTRPVCECLFQPAEGTSVNQIYQLSCVEIKFGMLLTVFLV